MNEQKIIRLVQARGRRAEEISKLKREESVLRMSAGQDTASISFCGRRIDVTTMDGRTYMPKMIRGMEMVRLGLLKWYAGAIQHAENELLAMEQSIRDEVAERAETPK